MKKIKRKVFSFDQWKIAYVDKDVGIFKKTIEKVPKRVRLSKEEIVEQLNSFVEEIGLTNIINIVENSTICSKNYINEGKIILYYWGENDN